MASCNFREWQGSTNTRCQVTTAPRNLTGAYQDPAQTHVKSGLSQMMAATEVELLLMSTFMVHAVVDCETFSSVLGGICLLSMLSPSCLVIDYLKANVTLSQVA